MELTETMLDPQPFIGIRDKVRDPGALFAEALPRLHKYAATQGTGPAGPAIGIYYEDGGGVWDMAVGVHTATESDGDGDIFGAVLPGGRAVLGRHVGSYEGLGRSWQAFMVALASGGYTLRAEPWEEYRTGGDDSDPKDWLTVLVAPVN
jgi:effector-binding domain-containing protein